MREAIKYVNHLGQSVTLFGNNVFSNHKDVRAYIYELKNGYGKTTSKEFDMLTVCTGGRNTVNKVINLLEVDAVSNNYGKLYINDWYIRCKYIGLSSIEKDTPTAVKVTMRFYAPSFEFTKEKFVLLSSDEGETTDEFLDFDFDFNFDLGGDILAKSSILNEQLVPADFILKFKAVTDTVNINIGDNSYIVATPINAGETFVINTEEKTVYKESKSGKIDLYNSTSDTFDIFEKIPSGEHIVSWIGDFDISLMILEHRSVAPWI